MLAYVAPAYAASLGRVAAFVMAGQHGFISAHADNTKSC
jgi:hypothetical protein